MQKLKKSLFRIFLVLLLVSGGSVYADDIKTLTLHEALNITLEENLGIKIAEVVLENAKLDYQKTLANNLIHESISAQIEAEIGLLNATEQYQESKEQVVNNLLVSYFDLLMLKVDLQIQEKQVELSKRLLKELEDQVLAGYKGQLELSEKSYDYKKQVFAYQRGVANYRQLCSELCLQLELEETELDLVQLETPELWQITEEELWKTVQKENLKIKISELKIQLNEYYQLNTETVETPDLELKKTRNNLKLANLDYANTLDNLKLTTMKLYDNYQQTLLDLELSELNLETAEQNLKIMEAQFAAGLKTTNDLWQAEIEFLESKSNYQSMITDFYTSQVKLQQRMGWESEVVVSGLAAKN